jgi:Zn-dependent peptidase ImmA (M78 family)/transcriptional regulator with XRE-family HTH domain
MPRVNPAILSWARETVGLSVADAARQLALSEERLQAFEAGERDPTAKQLAKMAEKYRRPLLAFYLPAPPQRRDRGHDFRTLPGERVPGSEETLDALLRDIQARQRLVRAALEEADEAAPIAFVASGHMRDGVNALVAAMTAVLREGLAEFRAQRTVTDAFSVLREAVERNGVFVLLAGNLGTHHSNIDPQIFRGFALSDPVAPFVVINENDSRAAWSFTLLHELAHIWLGQTGISGYGGEVEVERFCDEVAARLLLDMNELRGLGRVEGLAVNDLKQLIERFAVNRNLSRKMVAYNLMRAGMIPAATYRNLARAFDNDRIAEEQARPRGEGGPDYYVVRRHRIGTALVTLVGRMVEGGVLSSTKAGKVLGVKPTAVGRIVNRDRAA